MDAFVDALTNPVKDAKADPTPPDVATENCDKTFTNGGVTNYYAEHAYPGKTATDLANVTALLSLDTNTSLAGYPYASITVYLKDGKAGVACAQGFSVKFVRPN